jgi:hypothetical protein
MASPRLDPDLRHRRRDSNTSTSTRHPPTPRPTRPHPQRRSRRLRSRSIARAERRFGARPRGCWYALKRRSGCAERRLPEVRGIARSVERFSADVRSVAGLEAQRNISDHFCKATAWPTRVVCVPRQAGAMSTSNWPEGRITILGGRGN